MSVPVSVLDASVVVDVLLVPSRRQQLTELLGEAVVAAPAHVDAEVASALSRLFRAGRLTAEEVGRRLTLLESIPFRRYPVAPLLARAWLLRENVSMLDALYVALSQELGTTVLTTDARLSRAHTSAKLVRWAVAD